MHIEPGIVTGAKHVPSCVRDAGPASQTRFAITARHRGPRRTDLVQIAPRLDLMMHAGPRALPAAAVSTRLHAA